VGAEQPVTSVYPYPLKTVVAGGASRRNGSQPSPSQEDCTLQQASLSGYDRQESACSVPDCVCDIAVHTTLHA
jgi:hypothetical protein